MKPYDYGRAPIKATPKPTSGPSCTKCRHLRTDGKKAICGHWNAPAVESCDQFADASKPRHEVLQARRVQEGGVNLDSILGGIRVPRLFPTTLRTVSTKYRTVQAVKPLLEARVLFREDDVLKRDPGIRQESIRRLMLRMAKRGQVRTYRVARQTFWVGAA